MCDGSGVVVVRGQTSGKRKEVMWVEDGCCCTGGEEEEEEEEEQDEQQQI